MRHTETIAIILPALNEEHALRGLLTELPTDLAHWIIVVDNGSSDNTALVAQQGGAVVVGQPERGYGRACWSGLHKALELGADILVFMDADGSDDPADLQLMLAPILQSTADLVIGSRVSTRSDRGALPPQARLGNWLVSHMINILYGTHLHDIGSFRVIRTGNLQALHMQEMTFGWPVEMVVKAARSHYHIQEISIHYRRRNHGKSKVTGTIIGSIKAAYFMLSTTLRYVGAREIHE